MTRTERIPTNPNHYVGNHPLIRSYQLDQYYPVPADSRPTSPSAFNDASFRKSRIDRQPCPLNRKSLERAIQQISAAELIGGEHVIGYLPLLENASNCTCSKCPSWDFGVYSGQRYFQKFVLGRIFHESSWPQRRGCSQIVSPEG